MWVYVCVFFFYVNKGVLYINFGGYELPFMCLGEKILLYASFLTFLYLPYFLFLYSLSPSPSSYQHPTAILHILSKASLIGVEGQYCLGGRRGLH